MTILSYLIGLIISGGIWYFFHPPLNLASPRLFLTIFLIGIVFTIIATVNEHLYASVVSIAIPIVYIAIILITALFNSPIFRSHSYANLVNEYVVNKNITEYEPTIKDVPLMDRNTAELLASRQMGSLINEVSQFSLDRSYQINFNNKPIRVVPLKYNNFFKWLNNRHEGIPAYLTVDMATQNTKIHYFEKGMKYSPSGYFGDDLKRKVQFSYPTTIFGNPVFELDEAGNPYWVFPIIKYRIGLVQGRDVDGAVIINAISGESHRYNLDEIPNYIDNIYPSDILIDLFDYYGKYQNGFWNSLFGQKGVIKTTDGYNYIPLHDDIWVYTGVTSVVSDDSNIGFVFMNKRTKEMQYYQIAGAEEFSAMKSAEGMVQNLGYDATFPLLLQIENQPTYCLSLKDEGGLVKMYGLVNMSQYQIVVTGTTINECLSKYHTALKNNGQTVDDSILTTESGIIEDIRSANINGTTYIYALINNKYYSFNVADNEEIILFNVGDSIQYSVLDNSSKIGKALYNKNK